MSDVFYSEGLRFECTRCSRCCRHTAGYVFLSQIDCDALCRTLGQEMDEFLRVYCRKVDMGLARRVSLKEKANLDCIFWENDGCSVYEARPLQCRSFPFWSACIGSREEWDLHAAQCPGMGTGALHTRHEIDRWLAQRLEDELLDG